MDVERHGELTYDPDWLQQNIRTSGYAKWFTTAGVQSANQKNPKSTSF